MLSTNTTTLSLDGAYYRGQREFGKNLRLLTTNNESNYLLFDDSNKINHIIRCVKLSIKFHYFFLS